MLPSLRVRLELQVFSICGARNRRWPRHLSSLELTECRDHGLQVSAQVQETLSRAARRCTTAAEESCTTGTMRKD